MARHKKPTVEENSLEGWSRIIKESGEQFDAKIVEKGPTRSLAERVLEAETKLAEATTIAGACYWQGALDALNALSRGERMPEVIGAGVPK